MKFTFSKAAMPDKDILVVFATEGGALCPSAQALDEKTGGAFTRIMEAGKFEGKKDQTLPLLAPPETGLNRAILVGLGDPAKLDENAAQALGGTLYAGLSKTGPANLAIMLDEIEGVDGAMVASNMAFGAMLRSYRFDKYKTKVKKNPKPTLKKFTIHTTKSAAAKKAFGPLEKIADGVFLTRDLVSEPANILYPESFADRALALKDLGLEYEVLTEKQMKKLGMGALLGVAQGSIREPKMVIMKWNGGKKGDKPVAFVGKGVCFDTGGISLKPPGGMEDMKWDMGGAGVVTGLMAALAGRKAKVNAIGVLGLVENMPGSNAQRPGDVVTSYSGQTIEVLNTDAEGRLVLCDCLSYIQEKYEPKTIVDLATLTGAIIVALGSNYAGLFSNDDDLSKALKTSGEAVGEGLWRMPLGDKYDKQLDCDVADMKNIGGGREGGAITAAQFIKRFIKDVPWAHLDIAGVTWSKKDAPTVPKGGTAFGVRLLDHYVATHHEK